jgi:hypothetical protein
VSVAFVLFRVLPVFPGDLEVLEVLVDRLADRGWERQSGGRQRFTRVSGIGVSGACRPSGSPRRTRAKWRDQ